jgi:hypothetical protein
MYRVLKLKPPLNPFTEKECRYVTPGFSLQTKDSIRDPGQWICQEGGRRGMIVFAGQEAERRPLSPYPGRAVYLLRDRVSFMTQSVHEACISAIVGEIHLLMRSKLAPYMWTQSLNANT